MDSKVPKEWFRTKGEAIRPPASPWRFCVRSTGAIPLWGVDLRVECQAGLRGTSRPVAALAATAPFGQLGLVRRLAEGQAKTSRGMTRPQQVPRGRRKVDEQTKPRHARQFSPLQRITISRVRLPCPPAGKPLNWWFRLWPPAIARRIAGIASDRFAVPASGGVMDHFPRMPEVPPARAAEIHSGPAADRSGVGEQ